MSIVRAKHGHKPIRLVLGLSLFIFPSAVAQTTIVIRRTPEEIVVGADSLVAAKHVHIEAGVRTETLTPWNTCKVARSGNRVFAFTGYMGDPLMRITTIFKQACQHSGTLSQCANDFDAQTTGLLTSNLERLRKLDIVNYRRMTVGRPPLEVYFAGIERGIPKFIRRSYMVSNPESKPVNLVPDKLTCPTEKRLARTQICAAFGGKFVEILGYDKPSFWKQYGNVDGIRTLLKIMDEKSEEVGEPFDIVRLTKDGVQWVSPEPTCGKNERRAKATQPSRD